MKKFYEYFCILEEQIAKVILAGIVFLVFLAALFRCIGYPLNWSVDIAQLLFSWGAFFSADVAMRKGKLMGVDFVLAKMPESLQNALRILHYLLIIPFLAGVAVFGLKLCVENYDRTFQTMEISYSWVTLSAPVGAILMIITSIINCRRLFKDFAAKTSANNMAG